MIRESSNRNRRGRQGKTRPIIEPPRCQEKQERESTQNGREIAPVFLGGSQHGLISQNRIFRDSGADDGNNCEFNAAHAFACFFWRKADLTSCMLELWAFERVIREHLKTRMQRRKAVRKYKNNNGTADKCRYNPCCHRPIGAPAVGYQAPRSLHCDGCNGINADKIKKSIHDSRLLSRR